MDNKFKLAKIVDRNGDLSKNWYVEYYFEHPETGKFQQFKTYISKLLRTKQARYSKGVEIKQKINERLQMGWNPYADELPGKGKLLKVFENAIRIKERSFTSRRSIFTVRDTYRKFLEYLKSTGNQNILVENFGRQQAIRFLDWLMDTYNIGPRTHNNHLGAIKSIFNLMLKRSWIDTNPFALISKLPAKETAIRLYSRNHLRIIAEDLPMYNYDLYIVAMLIYYCALRPQEIVRLKRHHFIVQKGIIIASGDISKNKKQQPIAIPTAFLRDLKIIDFDKIPDNYYVFSRGLMPGEKQIASTRIAAAWRKFCRTYGIPDEMKIYDLKHTGGGMAIEAGIHPRDIQLQMRHSSLAMTEQYLRKFTNTTSEKLVKQFPDFASISDAAEYPVK